MLIGMIQKKGKQMMQKGEEKLVRTIVLLGEGWAPYKEWSGGRASNRSKARSPTGTGVKMETRPQKHTLRRHGGSRGQNSHRTASIFSVMI